MPKYSDPRLSELMDVPGLMLAHEANTDQRDCDACVISEEENAHTMRDYLPHGLSFLQLDLDRRATCYPAEILPAELVCWCGHSLHLNSCKDDYACDLPDSDHYGYCRQTWVERAYQMPSKHEAPAIWRCPSEGHEHTAKLAVGTDGRHCMVWCRDCMTLSEVDMAVGSVLDVTDR